MIEDLLLPLFGVALMELGDKTQLSVLLLASKTKKHLPLLVGVMLAFLIVDGLAILAGSWITELLPETTLKTISGIVFILFGIMMLKNSKSLGEERTQSRNPLISGFLLIFITEWGDKTQIAAALFATKYNTLLVLAGTMIALGMLSITAIYLGTIISNKIDKKKTAKIAVTIFILLGLTTLLL